MRKIPQPPKRCKSNERGSVLVMTAIAMLVCFLMLGLSIDISRIYLVRAELQNAADAAALSAARELNSSTQGIDYAAAAAVSPSLANTYSLKKIAITINQNTGVEFAVNLDAPDASGQRYVSYQTYSGWSDATKEAFAKDVRFVRVTTQAGSTNILFAVGILGSSHSETRQAVAGMSVGINRICDFFPVAVALTDPNPAPGTLMTLNFVQGSGSSATLSDKDYIVLEVPDINVNGSPETAVLSGGVTTLCQSLALRDTLPEPDGTLVFKPDLNIQADITYEQYSNPSIYPSSVTAPSHTGAIQRRILVVPIVDLSGFGPAPSTHTYNPPRTPVGKFGAIFMTRRIADPQTPCSQAGNICGRLEIEWIDPNLVLGRGSYDPGGAPGDPHFTIPVLYK